MRTGGRGLCGASGGGVGDADRPDSGFSVPALHQSSACVLYSALVISPW